MLKEEDDIRCEVLNEDGATSVVLDEEIAIPLGEDDLAEYSGVEGIEGISEDEGTVVC